MKEDILHVMEISDKKRLEIVDDKIRALYGHSIPMHIKNRKQNLRQFFIMEPKKILIRNKRKRFISNEPSVCSSIR